MTILDDEFTVEFGAETYSAKETQASALVTVKRSGPTTDVMTVDYATGGGTATPDVDYKPVSGTLTFTKGRHVAELRGSADQGHAGGG